MFFFYYDSKVVIVFPQYTHHEKITSLVRLERVVLK